MQIASSIAATRRAQRAGRQPHAREFAAARTDPPDASAAHPVRAVHRGAVRAGPRRAHRALLALPARRARRARSLARRRGLHAGRRPPPLPRAVPRRAGRTPARALRRGARGDRRSRQPRRDLRRDGPRADPAARAPPAPPRLRVGRLHRHARAAQRLRADGAEAARTRAGRSRAAARRRRALGPLLRQRPDRGGRPHRPRAAASA